jgi:putative transposase
MARFARVVLPGYPHHVTQRGNRRQRVFFCDYDYAHYLELIAHGCLHAKTHCLAYCLMPNHVHLVLTPSDERGLRSALAEAHRHYTRQINFRYGWRGHLWQERFHSFPMNESHLAAAVRYVELNPVRAQLVSRAKDWKWSSAHAHLAGADDALVRVEPMLKLFPDWTGYLAGGSQDDPERIRRHTRTGRPLGDSSFIMAAESLTGRILARRKPGRKPGSNATPVTEK